MNNFIFIDVYEYFASGMSVFHVWAMPVMATKPPRPWTPDTSLRQF